MKYSVEKHYRHNLLPPVDLDVGVKMNARLLAELIPEYEAEFQDGRICLVPDYAVKIEKVDYKSLRKVFPPRRHVTDRWAYGEGFTRRVWRDKAGEFIMINGERISVNDLRIYLFTTDKEEKKELPS